MPGKSHEQKSLVGYSPKGCRVGHNLAIKPAAAYYLIIWLIKFSFGIVYLIKIAVEMFGELLFVKFMFLI